MALRVGVVYLDVAPRLAKGFAADLEKQVGGPVEKTAGRAGSAISGVAKNLALMAGGAFAAVKVKDAIMGTVDAASNLNEAINVTGLVFKENRGPIDRFVKSAQNLGLAETQARELSASVGGLLKSMGLGMEENIEWTQKLIKRGADLGSAFNEDPANAVAALGSALRGESEPARRFNIILSDAAVKAEALRLGLAKGAVDEAKVATARVAIEKATRGVAAAVKEYGEDSLEARDARAKLAAAEASIEKAMAGSNIELTDAQKTQARLSIIMRQSADVAGDFANTSHEGANAARVQAARIENLRAKIGTALLPVQRKAYEIAGLLIGRVEGLTEWFGRLGSIIASVWQDPGVTSTGWVGAIERIVTLVRQAFDGVQSFFFTLTTGLTEEDVWARTGIEKFALFVRNDVLPIVEKVAEFVKRNLKPILIGLGIAFVALTSPISLVVGGLALLYAKSAAFRTIVNAVVQFIVTRVVPAIAAFAGFVIDKVGSLVDWWKEIWPQVSEAIGHFFKVVSTIAAAFFKGAARAWQIFGDDIFKIVKGVFGIVKTVIETAVGLIAGIIKFVLAVINGDWGKAWDAIKGIAVTVWDGIKGVIGGALDVITGIIGGAANAIASIWSSLWDGIKSLAMSAANFLIDKVLNPIIEGINLLIRGINIVNPGGDIPYLETLALLGGSAPDETFHVGGNVVARGRGGPLLPGRDYLFEGHPEIISMGAYGGQAIPVDQLGARNGGGLTVEHLEVKGQDRPRDTARETTRALRELAFLSGM